MLKDYYTSLEMHFCNIYVTHMGEVFFFLSMVSIKDAAVEWEILPLFYFGLRLLCVMLMLLACQPTPSLD